MILVSEIKELGFELDAWQDDRETWIYEGEVGMVIIDFKDYQKDVRLYISELGYRGEALLKGEVTIERIENLIKALS